MTTHTQTLSIYISECYKETNTNSGAGVGGCVSAARSVCCDLDAAYRITQSMKLYIQKSICRQAIATISVDTLCFYILKGMSTTKRNQVPY